MDNLKVFPNTGFVIKSDEELSAPSEAEQGLPAWFLSFNDLLTLLLCFFLTLLSNGFVQKGDTAKRSSERNEIGSESKIPIVKNETGTRFARSEIGNAPLGIFEEGTSKTPGQRELVMRFRPRDYPNDGSVLGQKAIRRLKLGVKFGVVERGYVVDETLVEACFKGNEESSNGYYWHMASERALSLGRQVVDAGILPSTLKLRPLGPNCNVVAENYGSQTTVDTKGILISRIVLTLKAENGR